MHIDVPMILLYSFNVLTILSENRTKSWSVFNHAKTGFLFYFLHPLEKVIKYFEKKCFPKKSSFNARRMGVRVMKKNAIIHKGFHGCDSSINTNKSDCQPGFL